MIRTVHALLLIASLLTCPYRCLGMVSMAYADSEQSFGCACCAPPSIPVSADPIEQKQSPTAPDGECQCGNCLCNGAVLTDEAAVHQVFTAGFWAVDLLPQTASPAAGDLSNAWGDGFPISAFDSGRPLRLVLRSLQI